MARQISAGVGGVVKKVSKVPLGIGGVIKNAKKGVCGVGGVVKTFFSSCPISSVQVHPKTVSDGSVSWSEGTDITFSVYNNSTADVDCYFWVKFDEPITVNSSIELTATITLKSGTADALDAYFSYNVSGTFPTDTYKGSSNFEEADYPYNRIRATPGYKNPNTDTLTVTIEEATPVYGFMFQVGYDGSFDGTLVISSIKIDDEEILAV